jgi:Ca-activated chloride channel homolog
MFTDYSLQLRYLSFPVAAAIYLSLAVLVVLVGWRSLAWLGAARQWAVVGFRIVLLFMLVLLLGGVEAKRDSKILETIVMQDRSDSVAGVAAAPAGLDLLRQSLSAKPPGDRLGLVTFAQDARVDTLPRDKPAFGNSGAAGKAGATDVASALRLSLAAFTGDAMKRLVLISDGRHNQGDLDAALDAAIAAKVPVDVVPVQYRIDHDVAVEQLNAPLWRRQGEPFHLDVTLRNAASSPAPGRLTVTHRGVPIDLDATRPGVQSELPLTLAPGKRVVRVSVPAAAEDGVHRFRAVFTPDLANDALAANNAAEAFTFVRGQGRVLYVDNTDAGQGDDLLNALRRDGIRIAGEDHVRPDRFPSQLMELQSYDAVVLANVPRGPGGLSPEQGDLLAQYVHDTGGGLLMLGGPETLGAGNWQGTKLAGVLPLDLSVPAKRVTPAGAMVLVIDHSGSMSGDMPGGTTKLQSAQQSALLGLQTMLSGDLVGVVAFDGGFDWVLPLARKSDHGGAADAIRAITPDGGTNIPPALDAAVTSLEKLAGGAVGVKHVLLLTDGQSQPGDYDALLKRMNAAKITLSTIAVGTDADRILLNRLATGTGGQMYVVDDPTKLTQVFIREARTLRRSLIQEPSDGIRVAATPTAGEGLPGVSLDALPPLVGQVLTTAKNDPQAQVQLVAAGKDRDPVLATSQSGLGRVAVFTSDATRRWAPEWVASPQYDKFFAQLLRSVSRAPMSSDFEIRTVRDGASTKLIVDALGDTGATNGLAIAGTSQAAEAGATSTPIRLTQTAPGRYETTLPTPDAGTYVTALQYAGENGQRGTLLAGVSVPDSLEQRDLSSDDAALAEIAYRTGGRVLPALGAAGTLDLFDRANVAPATAFRSLSAPILCLIVGLLLCDVAARRIQWDRASLARMAAAPAAFLRSFTTPRKVETTGGIDALRRVKAGETVPPPAPDKSHKFEARTTVAGDIARVVGGAEPETSLPPKAPPATGSAESTGNPLLDAKRRAQQKIRDREEGKA